MSGPWFYLPDRRATLLQSGDEILVDRQKNLLEIHRGHMKLTFPKGGTDHLLWGAYEREMSRPLEPHVAYAIVIALYTGMNLELGLSLKRENERSIVFELVPPAARSTDPQS
jgi:hypothetical protein